jgi:signal peptidase
MIIMDTTRKGGKSILYRIFLIFKSIFIYLISISIVVGAVLFVTDNSPQKSLFGYRYYTVLTGSMEPSFAVGDMVIVRLANADDINVGDIITFNPSSDSDAYLTHRVVQKFENYENTNMTCFKTQGDANNTEDAFLIESTRVIGTVVFSVPKLGYIVRFVQLKWYFVLAFAILICIFFKLMGYYFSLSSNANPSN